MPSHECTCQNSGCQQIYIVKEGEIDDGYCSFECWEQANCRNPEDTGDVLETHVEEIIKKS